MNYDLADNNLPKVLIIDNNQSDTAIFTWMLLHTKLKLQIVEVNTYDDIQKVFIDDLFDLIIVDYSPWAEMILKKFRYSWKKSSRNITAPLLVLSESNDKVLQTSMFNTDNFEVVNKNDATNIVKLVLNKIGKLKNSSVAKEDIDKALEEIKKDSLFFNKILDYFKGIEDKNKSLINQLNNVFESAPDGIRVVDKNFNVLRVNQKFLHYTKQSGSTTKGKCSDYKHLHECNTEDCILKLILGGQGLIEKEISIDDEKVGQKKYSLVITPLQNDAGEVGGMVEHLRDITEWKVMQSQILHSQKMESIGQLAAGIAHEINTPTQFVGDNLSFIKDSFEEIIILLNKLGCLENVQKNQGDLLAALADINKAIEEADVEFLKEEIPPAISQSLDGVSRIASIVSAMKEFSHPGSGEKELFDVNKNITATVTVARNEWKYVSDVKLELTKDVPMIKGYPGEFNQSILNMIVNAAHSIAEKSKDQKGEIKIKTFCEKNNVIIEISDTGKGIPKEIIARLFDPFFTTKPVGKGTGQGLAIAHSVIVDKHDGKVFVDTALEKGTCFTIVLPLTDLKTKEAK